MCGICYGGTDKDCGSCRNNKLFLYNFTCVTECPPKYVAANGICLGNQIIF